MSPWEISLSIITELLIIFSVTLVINHLLPKWKKKEADGEANARREKTVKLDKKLRRTFIWLSIVVDLVGIFIVAFPYVIVNIFEFNYVATIIIWWVPVIFDNVILYFVMTEAKYDDTKIIVKKAFAKEKTFLICDIVYFSRKGHLKVKTKTGNFVLFYALYGTASLRSFLIEKSMNAHKIATTSV